MFVFNRLIIIHLKLIASHYETVGCHYAPLCMPWGRRKSWSYNQNLNFLSSTMNVYQKIVSKFIASKLNIQNLT
jgi:hypothetical protein